MLFILFPILAFICIFIFLNSRFPLDGTRQNLLRTGLVFAAYLVLTLEVLSLFKGITRWGLVLAWLVPVAGWALYQSKRREKINLPVLRSPRGWSEWLLLGMVVLILAMTFLVAWMIPPRTWDVLTYHMSRVAHWAQNRSVGHYITGIERQISMNPGAEMFTLNNYVLIGGDRLANITQWLAMLGSLIGVSLIAKRLGANSFGQWLSASIAATIPMGIVQSSSSITDYAATLWVVCAWAECLAYYRSKQRRSLFYVSLSAALAVLTKPVAIPYLIPLAFWVGILIWRGEGGLAAMKWAVLALLVIGTLNAGFFIRNFLTYGFPLNPVDTAKHTNRNRSLPGVLSVLMKNAAIHAGLPLSSRWNEDLDLLVLKAHVKLGLDVQDPRTTEDGLFHIGKPSTQEDLTTNPYHAYLILAVFPLMHLLWKKAGSLTILYGWMVVLGFVLFSVIFKWNVFGTRYTLPFFVLFAPFVGWAFSLLEPTAWGVVVAVALLTLSFPWLFQIDERPLVSKTGTAQPSILRVPRRELFGFSPAYVKVAEAIRGAGCSQVGLMLFGDDPEYLLWALMGAPRDDLRIEWIVAGARSARYKPVDFQPCAIVCTDCPVEKPIRGLDFAFQEGGLRLFMKPSP